ncbi:hypothetical protein [Negadavirga shengliensis]|uniref:Uncharacterized protein n=1 Tax=Negadavirga shengliensis TaxID=1389218 RepID=A0ABV9T3K5_9BACT
MAITSVNETLAQDTERLLHIQTADGNTYIGTLVSEDDVKLVLRTENLGSITIFKSDISKRREIDRDRFVRGGLWFENPQATRYFWSPNGYGLKKGEWYYQNVWIFFNQVSTGVTDNFSLGAGMVPLFLFAGTSTPVWITPKISIPVIKDQLNLGTGALLGTVVGLENSSFGILYGMSTFGSRDRNLTIGLGWGFAGGELTNRPTINIGGMIRTGARGYILTENYYVSTGEGGGGFLSIGGRRIINKLGLDFGLIAPIWDEMDSFIAFPWLGLIIPFGNY